MQAIRGWIILGGMALMLACCTPAYYATPPAPVYYPLGPAPVYYPPEHASIEQPQSRGLRSIDTEETQNSKSEHARRPTVEHSQIVRHGERPTAAAAPSSWIDPEPLTTPPPR